MKKLEKTLEYKVKALFFIESALVPFADAVDTKRRVACATTSFLLANDTATIVTVLALTSTLKCTRVQFVTHRSCLIPRAFSPASVVFDLCRIGILIFGNK